MRLSPEDDTLDTQQTDFEGCPDYTVNSCDNVKVCVAVVFDLARIMSLYNVVSSSCWQGRRGAETHRGPSPEFWKRIRAMRPHGEE